MSLPDTILNYSETVLPASRQQEGVWFHAIRHSSSYWNFVNTKSFSGTVQVNVLKEALSILVQKHASLRTNIRRENNKLYQVIRPVLPINDFFSIEEYDTELTEESLQVVSDTAAYFQSCNYDLSKDILICFRLIQFRGTAFLLLSVNHIITDAVSMQIFWEQLAYHYNILSQKNIVPETPVEQYGAFAVAQQNFLVTDTCAAQKKYWHTVLDEGLPVLDLPFCQRRNEASIQVRELTLPAQLANDARSLALRKRVTYSSVFQLAYAILLHKYSNQDKIVIGNIVNGRGYGKKSYASTIGFFADRIINVLRFNEGDTLEQLLQQVNRSILDGFKNGDVPYEEITREYNSGNKTGMAPLFRAAFNVIKNQQQETAWEGLTTCDNPLLSKNNVLYANKQYDIYLFVIDEPTTVRLRVEVLCDEESNRLVDLLMGSLVHILNTVVYNTQVPFSKELLLTQAEKELYTTFNNTAKPVIDTPVIHELFRKKVKEHPNNVAITCGQEQLSYAELDELSDRWAALLYKQSPGKQLIALLLNRSLSFIPAMLAILKSGNAYLPLDPDFPAARLSYMLNDAAVKVVITEESLDKELPAGVQAMYIEELNSSTELFAENYHPGNDLAYVIYTSGSTGQPKGVMIEHAAVVNFSNGINELMDFSNKTIYSMTTAGFDIFLLETLHALCTGATVVLAKKESLDNPAKAADEIIRSKADIVQFTPTRAKLMLQSAGPAFLANLQTVLVGGELLTTDVLQELQRHCKGRIYNMYGPTETTVWSCVKDVTKTTSITIGKPLLNTEVYILDGKNQQQGIGIYGEIAIAGSGLSRGYWNKPELTAEKFIRDTAGKKKLYKTGDRGRWLSNGELEIAGRNDEQVKIRGYRVEPGEIAYHVKNYPGIHNAVVLHISNEIIDDLFACFIADSTIPIAELRNTLKKIVPAYMVPGYFIQVDHIPLTPNNKTDKVTLAKQVMEWMTTLQQQPVAGTAVHNDPIHSLWWHVLQLDQQAVSKTSANFFEAGGHSLKALLLLEQVEKKYEITIPVRDFFQNPTIDFLQTAVAASLVNNPIELASNNSIPA